jgi:hypothetical protein
MTRSYVLPGVGPYHPLVGCLLKMQRAEKHFQELQNTVKAFVGSDPYAVVNEPDAKPKHYVARLKIEREPPPELSPIIGDIIHNARSALDHLVWLLIKKAGNDPTDRKVSGRPPFLIFTKDPFDSAIYATTDKWKNAKGTWDSYTKGMDRVDVGIIKRMQPYSSPFDPNLHPLARLNELSNWDKHRELHFAGQVGVVTGTRVLEGVSPSAAIKPYWFLPEPKVLKEGTIIARYEGGSVPEGEPQVNTNLTLSVDIAFGEGSPHDGLGVEDTLQEIGMHVSNVLLAFRLRFDGKL